MVIVVMLRMQPDVYLMSKINKPDSSVHYSQILKPLGTDGQRRWWWQSSGVTVWAMV